MLKVRHFAIIDFMAVSKRKYELALVVTAKATQGELETVNKKVEEIVKAISGKIIKKDQWPKRELAYPILSQKEAVYLFYDIEANNLSYRDSSKIRQLDSVLRYLLLKR